MRASHPLLCLLALGTVIAFGAGAAALAAADTAADTPPPSGSAAGATAAPAPLVPPLPENMAEIEAIESGELVLEPAPAAAGPRALSSEMAEIETAIAAEREQVARLAASLRGAADDAAALALEREIEAVKQGTEIAVLRIQARYAREAGREEQAQAIEAAVARMTAALGWTAAAAAAPVAPTPPAPATASGQR